MDMSTVKILLVTVLTAVVGGCIIGVLWGKHTVKKITLNRKPLLSPRERLVYLGMLVLGAACIALGVFLPSTAGSTVDSGGEVMVGEDMLPGAWGDYIENPGAADEPPAGDDAEAGETGSGEDQAAEPGDDTEGGDGDTGDAQGEDTAETAGDGGVAVARPGSGGGAVIVVR